MIRPLSVAAVAILTAAPVNAQPAPIAPPAQAITQVASTPTLPDLIRRYSEDESYISRFHRMEYSENRRERFEQYYIEWLERLDTLAYDELAPTDRIDFHLLRTSARWSLDQLAAERRRLDAMAEVLPFREAIQTLELARVRMDACDPPAAAQTLADISDKVKRTLDRVKDGRKKEGERTDTAIVLTPAVAQRAAGAVDELSGTLDRWASSYEEFVPDFDWWTRKPREEAQKQLRELSKELREEVAGLKGKDEDPLVGDPIGREALLADIRGEMLAYTPEELIAIGERELAWCEEQARKAAASMGYEDWKLALAKVKGAHVPPGEQAAFVRDEGRAMVKFLKDRDLITIPELCEQSWRLEMHSPETQKTLPYAVYGGQYMGVSYAAGSMPHDVKLMAMRGNNRHFTHIVTPHELIPGHHLQGFFAQREREYRRPFRTPFLVEGWALYWEFRLWDLGWAGATGHDADMDRIGMLFWRMHRAARIIVSLKYHLGDMTPQQMVDFLVERVGHEKSGATAEVRRYIGGHYSPLYQCGYMIGGLQLRSLYRELVESGQLTDKQFNDAVLLENSIPIELIRASLKGESLPKDWTPAWRFAESGQ
ncbi:MAG TPA: DUF885 family protein [Phycisphaerales bacterium]|nr:DUF885 family protein [Phycisphaerales bacterium]